jgi:hypothetical protein
MDIKELREHLNGGQEKTFVLKKIELNRDFFEDKENTQAFTVITGNEEDKKYGLTTFAIENETYYQLCFLEKDGKKSKIYCYHIEDLYDNESEGNDPMRSVRPIFKSIDSFLKNINIQ